MLKITESEYKEKLGLLPKDLQDKLLMLAYDENFINIINNGVIKSEDVVNDIGYATRMTALGFTSKLEMMDLIYEAINDEDETRRIFKEIDDNILVPNNLEGAPEKEMIEEIDGEEEVVENTEKPKPTDGDKYSENTNETAEDILREVENPTPAMSVVSEIKTPSIANLNINTVVPQQTIPTENMMVSPLGSTPTEKQKGGVLPATEEPQTPNKESILDSKLTESVVQPVKSTYYKVDPYREQP